jgi:hypothetical protein
MTTRNLTRLEAIEWMCTICSRVADQQFKNTEPADCFCGHCEGWAAKDFRFSSGVASFISDAVGIALLREVGALYPLQETDEPKINLLIEAWSNLCEVSQERTLTEDEQGLYNALAKRIVAGLTPPAQYSILPSANQTT